MMSQPSSRGLLAVLGVALVAVVGIAGYFLFVAEKKLVPAPGPGPSSPGEQTASRGQELYAANCAGCHGDKGDGNGPAARFLYPRPRNFGEAKFRLVSTSAAVPTDDDLKMVIRNGMPGSAMFAFGHLSDADIQALVGQVRSLIRAGVESRLRQAATDRGDEIDVAELNEAVDRVTKQGDPITIPDRFPEPTKESIARGQELYRSAKASCAACHGQEGKGDGQQAQLNDDGMPNRPRDFSSGLFKSGRERKQLYARLTRGLPGSPMPANTSLQPEEVGDIMNFILSLSTEEITARAQHRRHLLTAKRVASLPDEIPDTTWQTAEAVPFVVTPLWWRDYPEPGLQVSALHDGKSLAIRLSWNDPTRNESAAHTEDFPDMAAVQLTKANPEPFLGMGAADKTIYLWHWRAGRQAQKTEPAGPLDDYPFDMPIYRELTKGHEKGLPNFLTAQAAGNPHADPARSGSNLIAQGFGSTTFRPMPSQLVTTRAAWQNGRWVVELRRPLEVKTDDGLPLAGGERCSIAFAIWDGAARDRNGQKLVSIWHDLKLE